MSGRSGVWGGDLPEDDLGGAAPAPAAACDAPTPAALRHALLAGELRLAYQPIVSLASGAIVAVEALLRWQHPGRGLLEPAHFLAAASNAGLLPAFSQWALQTACCQQARWQHELPHATRVALSVNLAPGQLRDPAFQAELDAVLGQTALAPDQLWLELSEATLLATGSAVEGLRALRSRGFRLVFDDFAVRYAALGLLAGLPIDLLKMDRQCTAQLLEEPGGLLGEVIVQLAQGLGIGVVAKGVELPAQRRRLQSLGCTYEQGYLFSKPLSPGAMGRLLAQQRGPPEPLRRPTPTVRPPTPASRRPWDALRMPAVAI